MTKQHNKTKVVDYSKKYDDLLEQTEALLQQARNFNMRADEIVMKFDAIVSGLSTDE